VWFGIWLPLDGTQIETYSSHYFEEWGLLGHEGITMPCSIVSHIYSSDYEEVVNEIGMEFDAHGV
jgi:hypothetical protein